MILFCILLTFLDRLFNIRRDSRPHRLVLHKLVEGGNFLPALRTDKVALEQVCLYVLLAVRRVAARRLDCIPEELAIQRAGERWVCGWTFPDVCYCQTFRTRDLFLPRRPAEKQMQSINQIISSLLYCGGLQIWLCDDIASFWRQHNSLAKLSTVRVVHRLQHAAWYARCPLYPRPIVVFAIIVRRAILYPMTWIAGSNEKGRQHQRMYLIPSHQWIVS
jgi:hypothetical protein